MYGIWKKISTDYSMFMNPSYGTINPALTKLVDLGFVKFQKTMTKNGKRSTYYSLSETGREELKRIILEETPENPMYFLAGARLRIICADVLDLSEQNELFKALKYKSENIMLDSKNLLETKDLDFYSKIIQDNLVCEYKNFISLIEGVEHACKN